MLWHLCYPYNLTGVCLNIENILNFEDNVKDSFPNLSLPVILSLLLYYTDATDVPEV